MFGRKLKLLYLLALFQLVAGPLVLFQVTVLCKMTAREIPENGIGPAFQKALVSDEFQAALHERDQFVKKDKEKSPSPSSDPPGTEMKGKMPLAPWNAVALRVIGSPQVAVRSDGSRRWTPIWPQAPPGPPPREV